MTTNIPARCPNGHPRHHYTVHTGQGCSYDGTDTHMAFEALQAALAQEPHAYVTAMTSDGRYHCPLATAQMTAMANPLSAPGPAAELFEGLLEIAVTGPVRARGAAAEVAAPWAVAADSAWVAARALQALADHAPQAAAELAAQLDEDGADDDPHGPIDAAMAAGYPVAEWLAEDKEAPTDLNAEVTRYEVSALARGDINRKFFTLYVERNPRHDLWAVHDGGLGFAPDGSRGPGKFWGAEYADCAEALALAKELAPRMVVNGRRPDGTRITEAAEDGAR
ncbi:hypothetical protein ACFC1B_07240 [Streptomyces xiamenensis]|uniref:hypothetical protein n=1 Tax=Streptomyces xiamenensis TaxID=408015 RepID=UPI0035D54750